MISFDPQYFNVLFDDDGLQQKLKEEHQYQALQTELSLLSVIDKLLITLMLEGLSYKEIAFVIGITEPNVKVKIHRIKSFLKERLFESGK